MFGFMKGLFGPNAPSEQEHETLDDEDEVELMGLTTSDDLREQANLQCRFYKVLRTTVLTRTFIVEADSAEKAEVMVSVGMAHNAKNTPGVVQHGYSSNNFVQAVEGAVHRVDLTEGDENDEDEDDEGNWGT